MDIAGLLIELVSLTLAPICKCWKFHRGVSQYMKTINEKLEELNGRREDRELRMEAELLPGKKPKKEVELWLAKVEKINLEITAIEQRVANVKFFKRAKLGKKLSGKLREIDELYQKGTFPDGLVEAIPGFGNLLPTTRLVETTSKSKMEEVWECIMNGEVNKISVYGMGGIGKTTTVKHINNRVLEHRDKFDNAIWVTVSKASSVFKLQEAIACKLGLDISRYEDETTRAGMLYAALRIKKRYVLILDDLWEAYRLEDVGIPEPTSENRCKLVLTTRSLEVCRGMSCKSIRMELLTNEESWDLFSNIVGCDVLCNPNLKAIANEFVRECGRLPLAIITVAGSLKGVVDYCEWKTSLEELKAYTNCGNTVLQQLRFSYTRLNEKKLQDCLLYCVLYPEDARIYREELIEYLMDEGIIEGIKSREDGFEKGHAMLNKLENACLLEGSVTGIGKKYVKMHDLVRDMLIQMTSTDPRFLVEPGVGLRALPSEEKWAEDLVRVSLTRNNILDIPPSESPRCPRLLTLMLNYNKLLNIADIFFAHIKQLNVLDLSYTSIENLPESVSTLVNLTALLLKRCQKLKYVPSLANLVALRRLDLSYTGMDEVPQGMEMLVNLRYLNLDSPSLETLPDGILPKLSNLQCLVCYDMSRKLKVRGDELAHLKKLETFRGRLYDISHFNMYVKCLEERRTTSYSLYVGFGLCRIEDEYMKYNKVVVSLSLGMTESLQGTQFPLLLPKDIELLVIGGRDSWSSLCTIAHLNNASNLKSCTITTCSSIISVLSSTSCTDPLLQSLEELNLENLQNLHWLIEEEKGTPSTTLLHPRTFSSLRQISIQSCPRLKNLFTLPMLSSLKNLEEIHLKYCDQISRIISIEFNHNDTEFNQIWEEETTTTIINLPKLRVLELWGLPELKGICNRKESVVANSVQEVSIWNCPNLKNIPFLDQNPYPRYVRQIDAHKQWWESLEWQHIESKEALQPFCKFWEQE